VIEVGPPVAGHQFTRRPRFSPLVAQPNSVYLPDRQAISIPLKEIPQSATIVALNMHSCQWALLGTGRVCSGGLIKDRGGDRGLICIHDHGRYTLDTALGEHSASHGGELGL
jgi:hypothetical protein